MIMHPVFVDLQGFIVQGSFRVKEVAVLHTYDNRLAHYVFEAPVPWSSLNKSEHSQASWLMANHHGLRWEDGNISFERAYDLIRRAIYGGEEEEDARKIYVYGLEKKRWLTDILGERSKIIQIEKVYCGLIGRLRELDDRGTHHCCEHTGICALENVCKLRAWWAYRREYAADCD